MTILIALSLNHHVRYCWKNDLTQIERGDKKPGIDSFEIQKPL